MLLKNGFIINYQLCGSTVSFGACSGRIVCGSLCACVLFLGRGFCLVMVGVGASFVVHVFGCCLCVCVCVCVFVCSECGLMGWSQGCRSIMTDNFLINFIFTLSEPKHSNKKIGPHFTKKFINVCPPMGAKLRVLKKVLSANFNSENIIHKFFYHLETKMKKNRDHIFQ